MTDKNEEINTLLHDLIVLIQEKYNMSLVSESEEDDSQKSFRLGSNFAYYDVLELIQLQLEAFGYELNKYGKIVPTFGQKMEK